MAQVRPQGTRRHPRTRGIARILRENGWTPELMQEEWDKAVAALEAGCPGTAFRMFVRDGYSWDTMPAHLVPSIVGLADKLYASKAKADAEKAAEEARRKTEADARCYYLDHAEEVLVAKLDAGEELSPDEIADFIEFVPNYLVEKGDDRRWTRSVTTYCRTADGRFFRIDWEQGLTEAQEDQFWDQPVEVTLHEEERIVPTIRRIWSEVTGETVLWSADSPNIADTDDGDAETRLVARLDAGGTLSEWEIQEFLDSLELFCEDEGEPCRWDRPITTYCRTKDGRFFRVDWSRGLTESQENWYGQQPVEVTLREEHEEVPVVVRTWTEVADPSKTHNVVSGVTED